MITNPSEEALKQALLIMKWCAVDHEPWRQATLALWLDALAAELNGKTNPRFDLNVHSGRVDNLRHALSLLDTRDPDLHRLLAERNMKVTSIDGGHSEFKPDGTFPIEDYPIDPSRTLETSQVEPLEAILKIMNRAGNIILSGSVPHDKYQDSKYLLGKLHDAAANARHIMSLLLFCRNEVAAAERKRWAEWCEDQASLTPMDAPYRHVAGVLRTNNAR